MQKIIIQTKKSHFMLKLTSIILVAIVLLSSSLNVLAANKGTQGNTDEDGDGIFEATIHYYEYSLTSSGKFSRARELQYSYSGESKLVCIANRGTSNEINGGNYFVSVPTKNYNVYQYYFYILNDSGTAVSSVPVYSTTEIMYDSNGNVTSENVYTSPTNICALYEGGYSGLYYYSVWVEGDCTLLTYNKDVYDMETATSSTTYSVSEVAYAWLTSTRPPAGTNAWYSNFGTRSLMNIVTGCGSSACTINGASLTQNGQFYSGGTVYSGIDYSSGATGGIVVRFTWSNDANGSFSWYYYTMLPLGECMYQLYLENYKTVQKAGSYYQLSSITFTPYVHPGPHNYGFVGTSVSFTSEQLEAAGCFDLSSESGDPLKVVSLIDKGGNSNSNSQYQDPSGSDDAIISGDDQPNYKGDYMEPEESENFLDYLMNIANNLFFLPDSIYGYFSSPLTALKSFSDNFFDNMTSLIVPRDDLFQEYMGIVQARFPIIDDVKTVFSDFKDTLGDFGKSPPSISLPFSKIGGHYSFSEDLSFSFAWFEPYRADFHLIVSSIMWLLFVVNQFFNLKNLINATGGMATSYKVYSREVD